MKRHSLWLCASLLLSCQPPKSTADVELQLTLPGKAAQSFSYKTQSAEQDRQAGRPSVYLLPEDRESGRPWISLRYYTGNPVGNFWLEYPDPANTKHTIRYECFIPGKLSNGQDTLTWTDEGQPRKNTETGDKDCQVTLAEEAGRLSLTFDATLMPAKKAGEKSDYPELIKVQGKATIQAP